MKLRKFMTFHDDSGNFHYAISADDITVVAPNKNVEGGSIIVVNGLKECIPINNMSPGQVINAIEKHIWDRDFSLSLEKELTSESYRPETVQKKEISRKSKQSKKVQKRRARKTDE